jgi:hypothetical protein
MVFIITGLQSGDQSTKQVDARDKTHEDKDLEKLGNLSVYFDIDLG